MKIPRTHQPIVHLLLVTLLFMCACGLRAQAQSTTWQILPFPDSDWPGPFGQPATTNGGVITLQGQPVRSVQTFTAPLSISYDVVLQSRPTGFGDDGALEFFFIPTGLGPTQLSPNVGLYMAFRNYTPDGLFIATNNSSVVWGEVPFSISALTSYHVRIDVAANGGLTWIVGNVTNSIPNTISVPYSPFQLEIEGWQPGDTWKVNNFAVVPEPSTLVLAVVGAVGLFVTGWRKSRRSFLRAS